MFDFEFTLVNQYLIIAELKKWNNPKSEIRNPK